MENAKLEGNRGAMSDRFEVIARAWLSERFAEWIVEEETPALSQLLRSAKKAPRHQCWTCKNEPHVVARRLKELAPFEPGGILGYEGGRRP